MNKQVERIKAEIERRIEDVKEYVLKPGSDKRFAVVPEQLAHILSFIDSLKEEPASKDLDKVVYQGEEYIRVYEDDLDEFANRYTKTVPKPEKRLAKYSGVDMVIAVKAGANWQREQIMKDAVVASYFGQGGKGKVLMCFEIDKKQYERSKRVKIIIKED